MRILHLADLHFGKTIYGTSLVESGDQRYWVDRLLELTATVKPDAVVIAGDVYDRSAPGGEAVELLSRMLTALVRQQITVMLVSGNHDSAQRLAFARDLLEKQGLYISPALVPPGTLTHVTLTDEYGPVTFWLMPYLFPALAAQALDIETPRSYDEAVRLLLRAQRIDFSQRNVVIAHQNVTVNGTEGIRGGSESMVGGLGQVDYTAFDGFDYVALGHIHAGYCVGRPEVRYAGSPLCYHFDEARQAEKGPILITLGPKGSPVQTQLLHIAPLHAMRVLCGPLEEVRAMAASDACAGSYVQVVLTDCRVTPEISAMLHTLFENRNSILMELRSEHREFGQNPSALSRQALQEKSLSELFSDFYTERNGGTPPDPAEQRLLEYMGELMQSAELHQLPQPTELNRLLQFALEQEAEL